MEEYEKIELRSDDVQEILGTPPSWILRWGITFVFMGVIMLGVVSWIVKYPDIIRASVQITTNVPPVPVVSRSTGYLSKLLVKEGDTVKQGDLLVVLQSSAHYEDVFKLESQLRELDSLNDEVLRLYQPDANLILGDLQLNYSTFVQILKDFQFKRESNHTEQNTSQIEQQIKNTNKQKQLEKEKLAAAQSNLELSKQQFARRQILYAEKALSRDQLEEGKREIFANEQSIKTIRSTMEELDARNLQLQRSIMELQQTKQTTNSSQYNNLVESVNQLRTAITKWKLTYLMNAPLSGKISFFNNYWHENQDIKEGAEVMAIVPANSTEGSDMVGIIELQSSGSGKVKEGQRVVIKFDSYPYQEFGVVEGTVVQKALLPKKDNALSVRISLPQGLKTSYHKTLKFEQQMQGSGEIITEERRFIERMFDKLISVFKNH
jgi:multidrug efflux pump subunit AcrA (membrane-fusion protein)